MVNETRFVSDELKKRVLKVMADAEFAKEIESILFTPGLTLMLCNSEHSLDREIEYISSLPAKREMGSLSFRLLLRVNTLIVCLRLGCR